MTEQPRGAAEHTADRRLRERARAVIPGGMYGHQSAASLPAAYPQFMRGGRGARIWDVDGNEYVDLMCSYGPVVLGHQHPRVEEAAAAQAALGDCQNGPGPVMVDLAELLVRTVRHADWAMFAKNGTDATTMCCTIARAQTGRRKILVAAGAYHGAAPWCTPRPAASPRRTASTSATTPTTTWPACARPPPRRATTWPPSWSARSSTTPGTTRSWSTPRSPAACARCATPPAPP